MTVQEKLIAKHGTFEEFSDKVWLANLQGFCSIGDAVAAKDRYSKELEYAKKIDELHAALQWCSGSPSFTAEGEAREGWQRIQHLLED